MKRIKIVLFATISIILIFQFMNFYNSYSNIEFFPSGEKEVKIILNPLTGKQTECYYYKNGKLKEKVSFKNKLINGKRTTYHENGSLETNAYYIDNRINGTYNEFHSNEQLKSKVEFVNGKKEGNQPHFYDNGNLKSIAKYKNGELYKLQMPKPDSLISEPRDTVAYWPLLSYTTKEYSISDTIDFSVSYPLSELNWNPSDSLFFRYGITLDTNKIYNPHLEVQLSDSIQIIRFIAEGSGQSFLFGLITHVTDTASYNHQLVYREINTNQL